MRNIPFRVREEEVSLSLVHLITERVVLVVQLEEGLEGSDSEPEVGKGGLDGAVELTEILKVEDNRHVLRDALHDVQNFEFELRDLLHWLQGVHFLNLVVEAF